MSDEGSITRFISGVKQGDDAAAEQLWHRYFDRLVRVADQKLSPRARRTTDGEDLALSAIHTVFKRARADGFKKLENRDDLWKLLTVITARKVRRHARAEGAQKRGSGKIHGESIFRRPGSEDDLAGIAQIIGDEPTPAFANEVAEECERRLAVLDEELRSVALWRLEGYSNEEIAQRLGKNVRSVERKLNIIRKKWLEVEQSHAE